MILSLQEKLLLVRPESCFEKFSCKRTDSYSWGLVQKQSQLPPRAVFVHQSQPIAYQNGHSIKTVSVFVVLKTYLHDILE